MGEEKVQIDVPHVKQEHHWDCGLACSLMVLKSFKKDVADFDDLCRTLDFGQSVWTIDLANIMRHYGISNTLCTITLGVDKGYSKKSFYQAKFTADEQRVNKLFEDSQSLGLHIEQRSLKLEEIIQHLSKGHLLITLVDWSHLNCRWCDSRGVKCLTSMSCMGGCLNIYQGHFIVTCGYSKSEKLIYYKNPSYTQDLCCCSFRSFDSARKSYGTDEDLLIVFRDKQPSGSTQDVAADGVAGS